MGTACDDDSQSEEAQEQPSVAVMCLDDFPEEFRQEIKDFADNQALHRSKEFAFRFLDWIHQGGNGTPAGVLTRVYVAAWDTLPYLRHLSQRELADIIKKDKQSVGREVSRFRDDFQWLNSHMQSEQARATCRARERRKRDK